jgi:hypothetical protein
VVTGRSSVFNLTFKFPDGFEYVGGSCRPSLASSGEQIAKEETEQTGLAAAGDSDRVTHLLRAHHGRNKEHGGRLLHIRDICIGFAWMMETRIFGGRVAPRHMIS